MANTFNKCLCSISRSEIYYLMYFAKSYTLPSKLLLETRSIWNGMLCNNLTRDVFAVCSAKTKRCRVRSSSSRSAHVMIKKVSVRLPDWNRKPFFYTCRSSTTVQRSGWSSRTGRHERYSWSFLLRIGLLQKKMSSQLQTCYFWCRSNSL